MKVAFFTDTFLPQLNGVATSVNNLYKALKKSGHKITVVAPKIKGYSDEDPNIFRLPSSRIWPTIPDSARMPIPHKEWLQLLNNDYEIVHAHGNGLFSFLGLILARRKKIPFILTLHTLWDQYGHYFFGGKILTPSMINKLLKTFANKCDAIIAPSEKMKAKLIALGVKKPISIVPNFIDFEKFENVKKGYLRKKLNLKDDSLVLLTAGRLGKEKNFAFLIEAFAILGSQKKDVHLIIAGEGFEKDSLQKLINSLEKQDKIHLAGGIPIEDMPRAYADADIFVMASQSEVHPMVILEAGASGLPLVVVNDSAYIDTVKNNLNGFSLPPDKKQFASKLNELLDNPPLRKKLGYQSKKIIRENFNYETIINKLFDFYREILTKPPIP